VRPVIDVRRAAAVLLLTLASLGCFEERDRPTVPIFGTLELESDPAGAEVFIDSIRLGVVTPVTLDMVPAGEHLLELELGGDTPETFSFSDTITVPEEALASLRVPLQGGCLRNCPFLLARGRIDCRFTNAGDTCASVFFDQAPALEWPGESGADYGAGGRLLVAAIVGADGGTLAGDTLAIAVFDTLAWLGRRPVAREASTRRQEATVEYWASSAFAGQYLQGLAVRQTLVAVDSAGVEDAILIGFQIVNNSDDELYRSAFPWIPEGGFTLEDVYVGFGLDADVGSADDDLGSVDPDLNLAFMYDADFRDPQLGQDFADQPGLVGLATIRAPQNATRRTLTFWPLGNDWDDGGAEFGFAWRLLSGNLNAGDPLANHPSVEIGHYPGQPADYRMTDAYGPLTLAPGESVELVVGILLAEPVPGSFTAGSRIDPGNPTDPSRTILQVAANLRALAASLPDFWSRYGR